MLLLEHSAILLTCNKRTIVLKTIFRSFESGRFTQVLLYIQYWVFFFIQLLADNSVRKLLILLKYAAASDQDMSHKITLGVYGISLVRGITKPIFFTKGKGNYSYKN